MKDPSKVVVVTSVCGRLDALELCLHSHGIFTPKETAIVVADASADGSASELAERYDATYLHTPGTKHPVTMHKGIEMARELGAEFVVQSNDDIAVPPEWIRVLGNEWEALEQKHGKVGMLGASTNFISGPQCRITGDFGSNDIRPTKVVRAFFAAHAVDSYFEVGGYPLDIPSNWFGDDALSIGYRRAGYKSFVSRLFVYHIGSQTMKGMDLSQERSQGEFWMSRRYPGWKNELYAPEKAESR